MESTDLWQRLERGLARAPTSATPATPTGDGPGESLKDSWKRFRRKLRRLDIASAVIWAFIFVKVFIADVDREALDAIGHGVGQVADYRAYVYLGVLIIAVAVLRKKIFLVAAYILSFPLLVIVWKVPGFFIRRRSFLLLLAAVQTSVNLVAGFRYGVISKGLALFAVLFIAVTHSKPLVALSLIYLAGLLLFSYLRLFRRTFSVSTFVDAQRRVIDRVATSEGLATFLANDHASSELEEYDYQQATDLAVRISMGVALNRGLYLWAYQLDRYRREVSPAVLFNGLSFVWLFLGTILSVSLINFGIFTIRPAEFSGSHISFLAMVLYSFGSLYLQDAGGIHAIGPLSQVVELATAILGSVVIAGFILNVIVTARRDRDEGDLRELIRTLKLRARDQERAFRSEYAVSTAEAYQRLVDLQAGLAFLLKTFVAAIPEDFFEPGDEPLH